MGCDIHMYIEYKGKDSDSFRDFGGRINPGRNYYMFGILSKGVRVVNKDGIEPKGMPEYESLSYSTRNDYQNYISENEGDDCVTPERAAEWVKNGYSTYTDERKVFVSNPDWHSHSWLTRDEYKKALDIYYSHAKAIYNKEPEYEVVLACLNSFEENGYESRIVFWFDN